MNNPEKSRSVQEMFQQIAPHYNLMNTLMTGGQDAGWRRKVIRKAEISKSSLVLDLGAGTGDLAKEAISQVAGCRVIAADFTYKMMQTGRKRMQPGFAGITWLAADAQLLPFPDALFDASVSGFLLRNVTDVLQCLEEQFRVLKPGGRVVALDTTPPQRNPLTPMIEFYLNTVLPALGGWVAGNRKAYQYLSTSTVNFLEPEKMADLLAAAGFERVGFQRLMFGMIGIYWGFNPKSPNTPPRLADDKHR